MPRLFASMMRFSIWSHMPRPWRAALGLTVARAATAPPQSSPVTRAGHRRARAVQRPRRAFREAHLHVLRFDFYSFAPEGDAHDRLDDGHAPVEVLEVLRLVCGAAGVRVVGVGLLGTR